MKPMLLDSFCVTQFIITAAASDFVPLGLIWGVKTNTKGPKHNQAQTSCLFFTFCNYASRRFKPSVYVKSNEKPSENRASERPSDRSTERPIDQAIQRPSDRAIDRAMNPLNDQDLSLHSK